MEGIASSHVPSLPAVTQLLRDCERLEAREPFCAALQTASLVRAEEHAISSCIHTTRLLC